MSKFFVYTEVQLSVPFDQAPWHRLNLILKTQKGLQNKTWLSGVQNNSVGGFYEFDSLENAQALVVSQKHYLLSVVFGLDSDLAPVANGGGASLF